MDSIIVETALRNAVRNGTDFYQFAGVLDSILRSLGLSAEQKSELIEKLTEAIRDHGN